MRFPTFAVLLLGLAGCSSPAGTPADAGVDGPEPADKSDADLTTPTVSFSRDILPKFQSSCGIAGSTCHGAPGVSSQGRPFLGYFEGGTDAAQVELAIVGVPSVEDPNMNIVTAGDVWHSYMWIKLDNLQSTLAAECAKGMSDYKDCGQSMPYQNPPLDDGTLNTIARWIAQGAKNN